MQPADILSFWFTEHGPDDWFSKNEAFDDEIRRRFLETYERASTGQTSEWRATPQGRLAEIIVLDQFSRNMFRGTARAFAADARALALAQDAVAVGADAAMMADERLFLYLPYMHSEELSVHEEGLPLFMALGDEGVLRYEHLHADQLRRFGRYPHRNASLNRASTPQEEEFLASTPGF